MSCAKLMECIQSLPHLSAPALVCAKVIIAAMPIAHIAVGAKYLDECPQQHYIPIYLIVMGVFGLLLELLSCLPCDGVLSCICNAWNSLTSFFLFCWFITGNRWIYSIYEPNYKKNATHPDLYCDKTLYLFAFWTTNLVYILLGLLLLYSCLCLISACVRS